MFAIRSSRKIHPQITRFYLIFIVLSFWPFYGLAKSQLPDSEFCLGCHQGFWDRETTKNIVHQPFLDRKCLFCHSPSQKLSDSLSKEQTPPDNWLVKSATSSKRHLLEFQTENGHGSLILRAWDDQSRHLQKEIPLKPLELLPTPPHYFNPPQISDLHLIKSPSGPLLTAILSWKTDRPTKAALNYNQRNINYAEDQSGQYSTNHEMTIVCNKSCLKHSYMIVVEDTSGKKSSTEICPINLSSIDDDVDKTAFQNDNIVETEKLDIDEKLFRLGKSYLIQVDAKIPFYVAVGFRGTAEDSPQQQELNIKTIRHIVSPEKSLLTIGICYRCHRDYKKTSTHPVNVYPKKATNIPPEYARLADGRITCITCHSPHASDYEYRTVENHTKALCLRCHMH